MKLKRDNFRKIKNHSFARFIVSGVINTASTYLLYLALVIFLNYNLAYGISYAAGIGLALFLNSKFVFKTNPGIKRMLAYPSIYVIQYFFGAFLLWGLVSVAGVKKEIAPIFVIIVNVPIGYILNKVVLTFKFNKSGSSRKKVFINEK